MLSVDVQSAFDYMPATLAGMAAGAAVVTLLFMSSAPIGVMLPWACAFGAFWLLRLLMLQRYRRALHGAAPDWQSWRLRWNLATLLSGGLWGVTAWVFYGHGDATQQTGLVIIVYTYCIAAVPVLANQPRLFLLFASLCFLPLIARIASEGDGHGIQLAGELLLIVSLTTVLARSYRQALARVTELKLRADDLLLQVRQEKGIAEAARHEAEVATRAKTRFLAAASHDLRQPLHAMGLFAGALRRGRHDPDAARLVESIGESVDALEALFSELLDITRIDSGGVEVDPRSFEVADMLERVRVHFGPPAFEKGVALRLRGHRQVVHGDPIIVERILRNLVSNAIRYTADGTVLVGFRRRGVLVDLQVWDTGCGIAQVDQTRIFEEFYQVPGRPRQSLDQRKGLGLGLAIVTRLANLMAAPLSLRSQPGHGSVFTLTLPIGHARCTASRREAPDHSVDITLDGVLIVVVEDDASVRKALDALLSGWGATVAAFDGVASAEQWAVDRDPSLARPHLAIVDYSFEDGSTGIDAIAALRRRFGANLPAIVVTGSTLSDLEAESRAHNFQVLLKPVPPNRLRASIAARLAPRSPTGASGAPVDSSQAGW
ncbi:MAG: hybrid sensor histidine kinase/response regulator [Caldimonas sp.]